MDFSDGMPGKLHAVAETGVSMVRNCIYTDTRGRRTRAPLFNRQTSEKRLCEVLEETASRLKSVDPSTSDSSINQSIRDSALTSFAIG